MEKKNNKRLIKVKFGQEGKYIEEGETLEQFKENFKKAFRIKSNENEYILSCLNKANRIIIIEDDKKYQNLKNIIINYPKLIEPSFIPKKRVIHKNSKCSECSISPIEGIKYQCLKCKSYELCSKCEKKMGVKHGHPLLKLRKTEYMEKYKITEENDDDKEKDDDKDKDKNNVDNKDNDKDSEKDDNKDSYKDSDKDSDKDKDE